MTPPRRRAWSLVLAMVVAGVPAAAQDRPKPPDEEKQQEKSSAPPEQPGWIERQVRSFTKSSGKKTGFFVTFGGIKTGSGVAAGPGFRFVTESGSMVESKGAWSVRNFKLAQVAVTSRPVLRRRVTFGGRLRWQDAPLLAVYAPGNRSGRLRGDYAETMSEASVNASTTAGWLRFDASGGYEWFATGSPPHSRQVSAAAVFPRLPGLYADPDYVHGVASLALDTRDGESYARHGSLVSVAVHRYQQQNEGSMSFDRADLAADRWLPLDRYNSVVYLGARASFTSPGPGNILPFFLMPALGGGNSLRGYGNYRFRDRHSLLLTGEYRWLAMRSLDVAVFYDAGKVAARSRDLGLRGLHGDVGIGVRLHGARTTALRAELARGSEGLRLILAFGK